MARVPMSLLLQIYGFIERVETSPPMLSNQMREESKALRDRIVLQLHLTDDSFERIVDHTIEQEGKLLEVMDKLDAMAKVGTRRKRKKVKP